MNQTLLVALFVLSLASPAVPAEDAVQIGVLNDQSSVYSVDSGTEAVEAVKMAVEDAGPVLGRPVKVLSADHQNQADVASAIAGRWYSEGVDLVLDVPNSSAAYAVQTIAEEKRKLAIFIGSTSSELTGARCSPYTAQWSMDTWGLSRVVVNALLKWGKTRWFFIGVDGAFGRTLVQEASEVVRAGGGQVAGAVFAPLGGADFSSYLLQAQASDAQIVGLANSVTDAANTYKQGVEFGLKQSGQSFAAFLLTISNVKSLTLEEAQGLLVADAFYWNLNDATRAFSARFSKRVGHPPDWPTALAYSSALHYLQAVQQSGTTQAETVMAKMRELPINDPTTQNARLRVDGRVLREMYLLRVKTPSTSHGPWDLYDVVDTVPAQEVTRPLDKEGCKLVSN